MIFGKTQLIRTKNTFHSQTTCFLSRLSSHSKALLGIITIVRFRSPYFYTKQTLILKCYQVIVKGITPSLPQFKFKRFYLILSFLQSKYKEKTSSTVQVSNTTWAHALFTKPDCSLVFLKFLRCSKFVVYLFLNNL